MADNDAPDDASHGDHDSDYYSEGAALADEFIGSAPSAGEQAALTHDQLWRLVDGDDLSETVRARIVSLVGGASGVSDFVVNSARGDIEKATASIRLRRSMLVASMFDSIRADAEAMIESELEQLAAIVPELLAAQRSAIEQQQLIANTMTEVHRLQMEGELTRQEIRNEVSSQQTSQHDDYMKSLRSQSDARHKSFIDSIRGSRY